MESSEKVFFFNCLESMKQSVFEKISVVLLLYNHLYDYSISPCSNIQFINKFCKRANINVLMFNDSLKDSLDFS